MAKAVALQMVVFHLHHSLDPERFPGEVLAGAPAALRPGHAVELAPIGLGPFLPGVVCHGVLPQRLELDGQLAPPAHSTSSATLINARARDPEEVVEVRGIQAHNFKTWSASPLIVTVSPVRLVRYSDMGGVLLTKKRPARCWSVFRVFVFSFFRVKSARESRRRRNLVPAPCYHRPLLSPA